MIGIFIQELNVKLSKNLHVLSYYSKAIKTLQKGQLTVLENNTGDTVSDETLLWVTYYTKKMLLVTADVESGSDPYDMDVDLCK